MAVSVFVLHCSEDHTAHCDFWGVLMLVFLFCVRHVRDALLAGSILGGLDPGRLLQPHPWCQRSTALAAASLPPLPWCQRSTGPGSIGSRSCRPPAAKCRLASTDCSTRAHACASVSNSRSRSSDSSTHLWPLRRSMCIVSCPLRGSRSRCCVSQSSVFVGADLSLVASPLGVQD